MIRGIWLGLVVLVAPALTGCSELPSRPTPKGAPPSSQVRLSAIEIRSPAQYSEMTFRADAVVWRKASFGSFSVALLREVSVENATIQIELDSENCGSPTAEDRCLDDAWQSAIELLDDFRGSAYRVSLAPFSIDVAERGHSRFRIWAQRAESKSGGRLILRGGLRLSSASGQELRAQKARLLSRARILVAGGYTLVGPEPWRTESRRTAVFRLDRSGLFEREDATRSKSDETSDGTSERT